MNIFVSFFRKTKQEGKLVFIVEDNEVYAKSLQMFLQTRFSEITEVSIFKIGEACMFEIHRDPDIVIMDYFLNSKYTEANNGLEIIKRIKALKPQTNIIVLSAQEEFDVVIEAIKLYDCNYVQKEQNAFDKVEHIVDLIFNKKRPIVISTQN